MRRKLRVWTSPQRDEKWLDEEEFIEAGGMSDVSQRSPVADLFDDGIEEIWHEELQPEEKSPGTTREITPEVYHSHQTPSMETKLEYI